MQQRVTELREWGNLGVEIQPGEDRRSAKERKLAATAYLATVPTKLVTVPILDGLGANAWETMIRRARVLFNTDEGQSLRVDLATAREARGGLAVFFDEIVKFMNEEGQKGSGRSDLGPSTERSRNEIIRLGNREVTRKCRAQRRLFRVSASLATTKIRFSIPEDDPSGRCKLTYIASGSA